MGTPNGLGPPASATIRLASATHEEPFFRFGPYIPLVRKDEGIFIDPSGIVSDFVDFDENPFSKQLTRELLPEDSILESPSLVTPLLIKKRTKWPVRIDPLEDSTTSSNNIVNHSNRDDDVLTCNRAVFGDRPGLQAVKVIFNQYNQIESRDNSIHVSDYMRTAALACLAKTKVVNEEPVTSIKDHNKSSANEMLTGIGFSQVLEYKLQSDARRMAFRIKRAGETECGEYVEELEKIRDKLNMTQDLNKHYKSKNVYNCPFCSFKSDSLLVINSHLEVPHPSRKRELSCNWCDFKIKDFNTMAFHCMITHKKRCRMDRPPSNLCCHLCPFDTKSKKKLAGHLEKCQSLYKPEKNLELSMFERGEPPGLTSKPIDKDDILVYEQTLKDLRLSIYNPHQIKVTPTSNNHPLRGTLLILPRKTNVQHRVITHRPPPTRHPFAITQNEHPFIRPSSSSKSICDGNTNQESAKAGVVQYPKTRNMSNLLNPLALANSNIVVTRGPPSTETLTNGVSNSSSPSLPNETSEDSKTKESVFVICEICDGYIKDLSQLRTHMQLIHKVKLHSKMLEARPPLACQRCRWRFFTDQGLERHLLGGHGLVTTNMQDLADQGADSGRCTNCGKAFANRLVAHMKEVHNVTLKSAHLSYKCTVCSATFNLYRLFENHVYSVHSDAVRRK